MKLCRFVSFDDSTISIGTCSEFQESSGALNDEDENWRKTNETSDAGMHAKTG